MRPVIRRTLRGGAWNLRKGRNRDHVAREVLTLLRRRKLHFLAVHEAADYIDTLRPYLRRRGYRVHCYQGGDLPARDTAVISKMTVTARAKLLHDMGGVRWERSRRNRHMGLHPSRKHVSVRVGWLRVMAMHGPPTPNYPRTLPLRHAAHAAWMDRLEQIMGWWVPKPYVITGDGNLSARSDQITNLCSATGATVHGRGIDFTLSGPKVRVSDWVSIGFGDSDHDPQLFDVSYR